ncbi:retrotransposon protein, putative, ty1-copia subclass [Tanacetum coccineum]
MTTSVVNNSVFRGFFKKQKLIGPNFIDWYRQLRIVLLVKDKLDYLEQPIPPAHVLAQAGQQVAPEALAAHAAWVKGSKEIVRLMLLTMESNIQQDLENLGAYEMLQELKTLFAQQADYIDNLKRLGHPMSLNLGRASVEAIGSFHLCLSSGLVIVLNNCHYAPSITSGIISVSRLYEDDFVNRFVDNTISVSRNNMVYFSAIPRDGISEIDLSDSYTNDSSMYAVSKRAKLNLDSALLWHCRLGHISKKRIEKLQHDGLLNSTDLRAFKKCVSCMSGKMAQKPYTHQVERAKYLLVLIHTDHKHEVFETFKVFQKEVENQLRKTIKLLRFDHGGEYMSQEFLDHQKEHGIIAHCTPPYTPQHNGVSERRNRTLLDMVRSMVSQITLPKSFWDYALETVTRILNMVPTKKVEKTPYEVWHGQAPKLSTRTRHAPDRMCLYVDAEEHELGDLGEPANNKAALLDHESDK